MTDTGFWSMGGYAGYVWPCFALAGAVLVWNLWSARQYRVAALSRVRRAMAAAASDAAPLAASEAAPLGDAASHAAGERA